MGRGVSAKKISIYKIVDELHQRGENMENNRWKKQVGLILLLLAVCGAAACGRIEDGFGEIEKAVTLKSMTQVKKGCFGRNGTRSDNQKLCVWT